MTVFKFFMAAALFAGAATITPIEAAAQETVDPKLFQTMEYRSIGPFRGGRVTAVAGIEEDKLTYYMGATGGGVWKTTNAGVAWENISDGFFNTSGIGAIDVADSDPNIVYVGTGEAPVRGVKTSHGDGVYKSTDAGKTWTHMGLKETRHISRIHVHPTNPDVVYLAAQGNPWGPNRERGVYKTVDGGVTWEKVLYVNADSGISDMSMDATNPDVLMATSWDFRRKPWVVKSGGPGSRVFKSTDGGANWKEITEGLPELKGKMGVSISPANSNIVYLAIEAKDGQGGVYRSDDAGETFKQVSDDPNSWARAWYYMHITADPNDEDEVWVMNGILMKSIDGGKTYATIEAPHVDHHAIWINPSDSNILINGNDGGANVSMDGTKTWSSQMNQPTGQFYRVITDNQYPYRIYSAQQDSNGITIASRSMGDGINGNGIGEKHWWSIGSGESATIAFNPDDPKYVYTTYFASMLGEWNRDTRQYRNVRPYPERVTGEQPKNLKYRGNWNGPVIVSPHNPEQIYYGSQYLMGSTNRGVSWEVLSEDLTRNNKDHQGKGGYPISNEQITVAVRNIQRTNYVLLAPRNPVRNISNGYPDAGPGANPPVGLQVHYVLNEKVSDETIITFEILNAAGDVVHSDRSDETGTICGRGQAAIPRSQIISKDIGDNRWSWDMTIGRFECLPEIYSVSGSMAGYDAAPGEYTVRMTIGDFTTEQAFRIRVDPRLGGDTPENLREYAEMNALSSSLFLAAEEMGQGVKDLRLAKEQLDLIIELDQDASVTEHAKRLSATMDGWIEKILQKELKTFQNVYQHEGRLLMQFKDLLGRMGTSELPLTNGFRDVTRDYLNVWGGYRTELATINAEDIAAFNTAARTAGVAEVYIP
ncbi:Dispase autolysis-inducing protein [Durusdinium trenchii]|uniref:Dispase autolysis-inducing protein n=1 Tax=Durusdinium trenchii TaxID=1381693 RepID=A0ABP0LS03_9DINO